MKRLNRLKLHFECSENDKVINLITKTSKHVFSFISTTGRFVKQPVCKLLLLLYFFEAKFSLGLFTSSD